MAGRGEAVRAIGSAAMSSDAQFSADHAPGSMVPTASAMPCLFIPRELLPAWAPSPYGYALHLVGQVPFPSLDSAILRRGRWLEPCGRMAVQDEYQIEVIRPNGDDNSHLRRYRKDIPAACWLDDITTTGDAVEYKSVSERTYREFWADGPPDVVLGQVHAQMAIDPTLPRVIVVAVVFGYAALRVERFDIERDPEIVELIADTTNAFVEMLRRGELPEYDASAASYTAWTARYRPTEDLLDLSGDGEAVICANLWREYADTIRERKAGIAACKRYFSEQLDRAGRFHGRIRVDCLDEDIVLQRRERKGYTVAPCSTLEWRFMKRG